MNFCGVSYAWTPCAWCGRNVADGHEHKVSPAEAIAAASEIRRVAIEDEQERLAFGQMFAKLGVKVS